MSNAMRGAVFPGVSIENGGLRFSVYSGVADLVELVLFKPGSRDIEREIPLERKEEGIWEVFVPGTGAGSRYGYRVTGPWDPVNGVRCNGMKILLDPYATGVELSPHWDESMYDYSRDRAGAKRPELSDLRPSPLDSSRSAPIGVVCAESFDWSRVPRPDVPWRETVIYEAHVKGLTALHPEVPVERRGTYLGLASEPVIRHLHTLGVTSIELLPVHASLSEPWLADRGLSNYWGYNTVSFFAPDPRFATAAARKTPEAVLREFKEMVRTFHCAGIEVILDVVYNHTAEGDLFGPTFSFRGFDNPRYYRHRPDAPGLYADFTGCGNTLDASSPPVFRLILDSLRYWASECGVDGFRIDLASAICRSRSGRLIEDSPLALAMLQDPILGRRKLIFEPWDATAEGYALGRFPSGISEWNGRYRDTMRRFWRGDAGLAGEFAGALSGSSELFSARGGPVRSSVNFVTVHDGFTLYDLVTYSNPRNEMNGEEGRDGAAENYSSSYGPEGPGGNEQEELRRRQMKNLLATLYLSLGVPMLLAGDEGGRTQHGNNNAYCQDNETSWVDWNRFTEFEDVRELIVFLASFRRQYGPLLRERFLTGSPEPGSRKADVLWMLESGETLEGAAWNSPETRTIQVYVSDAGTGAGGDSLLLLFNPTENARTFRISADLVEERWRLLLRTDEPVPFRGMISAARGDRVQVGERTLMIFRSGRGSVDRERE